MAEEEREPQPEQVDEELVKVFDTRQESEAIVIRGLLESAGIEALVSGLDAPQEILPGVGGIVVRVRPDQESEARRLIREHRRSAAAEPEVSEGPAA